jgi:2-oxoglutarate dehydrogenase E2 component (dihydrolipoamide succinyltransferase)
MAILEMRVPALGESVVSVTLAKWLKPNGSTVNRDEPLCEFETEKATQELGAESAGKLIWVAAEGDDLAIGAIFAKIDTDAAATSAPAPTVEAAKETPKSAPAAVTATTTTTYATGFPSPAAAKILTEGNVEPSAVSGSGKDGRITKDDAQKAVENKPVVPSVPIPPTASATPAPAQSVGNQPVTTAFGRIERRERMSRMRQTIARRLVSAKNNTAMLTTFNEVDMTEVMALRDKYNERFAAKYGIKLGFMSIFAKACAKMLMEMPEINASIDGTDIIYHDFADISIAISTPTGLVVPPIRNVESMKYHEFELALKKLAGKAREGKLSLEEMTGGTFTITNGGTFGSLMSTPIINEPQSAILGLHAIKERPIAVGGEVKIRPMMYLALSYDHRVIDGSSSVTFLVKIKNLLEDPMSLLLDL